MRKNKAATLRIRKTKCALSVQGNKKGLRPERGIHADFHELPLLVRHLCRVREYFHKLGAGHRQGGNEQDVFQDKPLGVFPYCYPNRVPPCGTGQGAQSTA